MRRLFTILLLGAMLASCASAAGMIWAKGQLHCHSTASDGNVSPQEVADWYKDHGFDFLFLTDHRKVTDPAPLDKPGDDFIMIPGEEFDLPGKGLPIHANALGLKETLGMPPRLVTPAKSVVNLVDYIRKAGAIPMVNHPNWYFSLNHRELLQIEGTYILEMLNMGGPTSYNEGSAANLSTEQVWDILLSEGRTVYAAATDDAHDYKEFAPGRANPGLGWVVCRVPELTPAAVLDALAEGRFYSSIGVELADYSFDGRTMKVSVVPKEGQTCLIRFVGKHGRVLREVEGTSASYTVAGAREKNDYIRCKVVCSDNTAAWTQAERL